MRTLFPPSKHTYSLQLVDVFAGVLRKRPHVPAEVTPVPPVADEEPAAASESGCASKTTGHVGGLDQQEVESKSFKKWSRSGVEELPEVGGQDAHS